MTVALSATLAWFTPSTLTAHAATTPALDHVFVVVMENKTYGEIIGSSLAPYVNGLLPSAALGSSYFGVTHPSLPNYLALTGGSTFGISTDCTTCWVASANIADSVESAGKTWKAYEEGLPSACLVGDSYPYMQKHDPFIYFNDIRTNTTRCTKDVVPFSQLATDLQSTATTPNYAFITPDMCDDTHDCTVDVGDAWLQQQLPAILGSPAFTTQNSLLVVTWDESDSSATNQVPVLFLGKPARPGFVSAAAYNHYSLLHTIEAGLGLSPLTTNDTNAPQMTDMFAAAAPSPSPSPSPPTDPSPARVPLPSDRLQFGLANQPADLGWMTGSGVPWKYRYAYLAGGVNTGGGWETWNSPAGAYATFYMNNSLANGYIPVLTYYDLLQSNPSTGSSESDRDFSNLNNATTMYAYYANFKLLMQEAGAFGKQVVVHVEPDLWGYMQQRAGGGSAATLSASVAGSGFPDVTGLPDTVQGFAWALLKLRDLYAPNALLAIHASLWGSGIDLASTTDATTKPVTIADSTAAFLNSAGIAPNPNSSTWDAVFNDVDDHDAAWWEQRGANNAFFTHWWDTTNTRAPNFSRYLSYVTELHAKTSLPQVVWQVPIGNQYYLTMNNTCGHYQDNVAQYFLAHTSDLFNAGLVAVMFGAGNKCQATNTDTPADGVTNNNSLATTDLAGGCNACNTHMSSYSDNDGGFLRVFVGRYYWTASYAFTAPSTWVEAQTQSVSVTLTNTGGQTWVHDGSNPVELDMHFTSQPGGSGKINYWSTSQVFALPGDVAPSSSVTFSVPVTAPASTSGSMYLEAELFKNQQFWFTQAQAQPVTVNQHWQSMVDLSGAPTSWVANQSRTFSLTVTNQGDQAWVYNGTNPVELDLHFTTHTGGATQINSWLTSQVFPLTADVAPGASLTLSVTATAPNTSGSMSLEATMFKNQQFWFQQSSAVAVTVAPATWAAGYSFIPPATWVQGQTQSVSITLNNTGNQTWMHMGANPVELDMHFTTRTGGSSNISSWLTSQIFQLPSDVAPAGSVTFSVMVTAPSNAAGLMSLEAELFKNQQFWFTQAQAQPVTVNFHWQGSVDLSAAPTSWAGSQTQSFSITVTNQGDQTWLNSGTNPVELDINFSTQNGGNAVIACCWKTSQIIPLPSSVAPGASVTFTVTVTAPSGAGSYFLEAQLFKNQQFWFGTWNSVPVTAG